MDALLRKSIRSKSLVASSYCLDSTYLKYSALSTCSRAIGTLESALTAAGTGNRSLHLQPTLKEEWKGLNLLLSAAMVEITPSIGAVLCAAFRGCEQWPRTPKAQA